MLNIVLYQPEIPPNTGNIARLCAATCTRLHLIPPLGFELSDRTLKRAGMDYWNLVEVKKWESAEEFLQETSKCRRFFLTTKVEKSIYAQTFEDEDYLVFGRETKGLPESWLKENPQQCLTIPMLNADARSLNLATSVGIVLYEACRQIGVFEKGTIEKF